MKTPEKYSFSRYLSAKKSVDARAFNHQVWTSMRASLFSPSSQALQITEIGAGIGTMALRFLSEIPSFSGSYTLIEQDLSLLDEARSAISDWASSRQIMASEIPNDVLRINRAATFVDLHFINADIHKLIDEKKITMNQDLIIAHAFLDLVDVDAILPGIFASLRPGGYFYFPINYDGHTIFEPAINPVFEEQLLSLYNLSMDEPLINGKGSGDSQSGRHLFHSIQRAGANVISAGSSDWVITPINNKYQLDEAYFLFHILDTIQNELKDNSALDQDEFQKWLDSRRKQIFNGELIFIAHQLDFFGNMQA